MLVRMNAVRLRIRALCLAASLACCAAAAGQGQPAETAANQLDEVEVVAKKLSALREEAVAAEDRFFRRFNELNDDDRFDVHCQLRARTGTRHETRECNTELFGQAASDYSSNILAGVSANSAGGGGLSAHATRTAELVMMEKKAAYRKAVMTAFARNPELVELAREREAAWNRYENERRKRIEGMLFLAE